MTSNPNPNVSASVIIPAHNAQDTIARQLEALTRQVGHPAFETIVIANQCSDDTVAISLTFSGRLNLLVLEANERPSAAHARNVGVRHASGEYLLFCDADDEVQPEWVSGMVEGLASDDIDFVPGSIELDRSRLPMWIYHWFYAQRVENGIFVNHQLLPIVMTASLGVSRSAFDSVGGFDERFPGAAGEDVQFVRSLFRAGNRLGPAPRAKVLYSPRTGLRSVLAQSKAYHRGRLVNAELEGAAPVRACLARNMKRALRRAAGIAIRRRYAHPLLMIALFSEEASHWRVDRSQQRSVSSSLVPHSFRDFCVPLKTPVVGGRALSAPRVNAGGYLQTPKGAEMGTHRLISVLLPDGGFMVDVGANIGSHTIAGAIQVGLGGKVVAFEPGLEARTCLIANVDRHGVDDRVTVFPLAVGSNSGQRIFHTYENSLLSGFAEALDRYRPGNLIREDHVDVVALDDVISGPLDLLKIDVEGFEDDVLVGARHLIEQSSRLTVIVEMNFRVLHGLGRSAQKVLDHFPRSGWILYRVDEEDVDTPLQPLDRGRFLQESLENGTYFNVVAVRMPHVHEVESLVRR